MIELTLNGEPRRTAAPDLTALLTELNLVDATVATALNGEFVPKGRRASTRLKSGDAVDVVAPMQGG